MTIAETRAPDAPREDLIRMTTTLRQSEDGGTLFGYAAVFNQWTEIDSWEGKFRERLAPGAFRKTLRERRNQVKVLFNHGMDPSIGDKPLGKPKVMEEDSRGLKVEVPLDETSYNADIKALLRSGALDGMSFRMTVTQEEWDKLESDLPERTIKEVRLYEFGPVTFPAYEATQAGVRAHAPSAFEAWRSATGSPKTVIPGVTEQSVPVEDAKQPPPAGEAATEEPISSDSGPEMQATRSEDQGDPPHTYQPAQRAPMSPERRQAQIGMVRAFLAQTSKE